MNNVSVKSTIPRVDTRYGAPMGRGNVGSAPVVITRGRRGRICRCDQVRVYDRRVPMIDGAYDAGGAYWGLGGELRVRFTRDLGYVEFYRRA